MNPILLKILLSIGYIVILVVFIVISIKIQALTIEYLLRHKSFFSVRVTLLGIFATVLIFALFGILTMVFPIVYLLILSVASVLFSLSWMSLTTALLGLSSDEKKEKVLDLILMINFQQGYVNPRKDKISGLVGLLLIFFWVLSVVIFWIYPFGSEKAIFYLSITTIVIPLILGQLFVMLSNLSPVTSALIDDDVRNFLIVKDFPQVVINSFFMVLPIWFINRDGHLLPIPNWALLMIPIILFTLLVLIPYFIGIHNHKRQKVKYLEAQRKFVENLLLSHKLPQSEYRDHLMARHVADLKLVLDENLNSNLTLKIYNELKDQPDGSFSRLKLESHVMKVLQYVMGNYEKMARWDISLEYISRLQDLEKVHNTYTKDSDLRKYLKFNWTLLGKEIKEINETKNLVVGALLSATITVAGFAIKYLEEYFFGP